MMKAYNKSLDYVVLAMAKGRQGDTKLAAKLFAKALAAPDAMRAIAVLEHSNKTAYAATQASASVKKPVKAAKKVEAEFDMGEDDDLEGLVTSEAEDGDDEDMEGDEGEEEEVDASEEDEDEGDFDAQFASVLASMAKKSKKARR